MSSVSKLGSNALTTANGFSTSTVLAGGLTNASVSVSAARPYSLATMDVDTGLRLDAINRKLQIESTLDEVFMDIGADVVFTGKRVSIPDACIMRISSEKGARTQSLPLINPLAGPGRGGTDEDQQGYERSRTLQYMKIYYNEYSQAVMGEKWGMTYNDLQVVNYYGEEQPGLSKWFAEDEGKQYREALLERYSWVLEKTGTALTQEFNPNQFWANTELGSQPTYSSTAQTFYNNMAVTAAAADTGTAGVNANIDLDYLLSLDYYAQNQKRIEPIMIGGKKSYIVLLPSSQYHKLLQDNDGQLGNTWTKVTQLSEEEQNYPGIVGRVRSLIIVEDQRYPTIEFSDYDAGTATITPQYVETGNTDGRNKTVYNSSSNMAWDVGSLMGKNAITDWKVTPLHFEMENSEYTKRYGKGAFCERGIQLGNIFDTDSATNLNLKNFGSIELMFTATSIVTTA